MKVGCIIWSTIRTAQWGIHCSRDLNRNRRRNVVGTRLGCLGAGWRRYFDACVRAPKVMAVLTQEYLMHRCPPDKLSCIHPPPQGRFHPLWRGHPLWLCSVQLSHISDVPLFCSGQFVGPLFVALHGFTSHRRLIFFHPLIWMFVNFPPSVVVFGRLVIFHCSVFVFPPFSWQSERCKVGNLGKKIIKEQ